MPKSGAVRLFVALVLAAAAVGAQAACKAPPIGALPQPAAGWSPVDEAFYEGTRFCKHRHLFDFRTIESRDDLDVVESAIRVVLSVGNIRRQGPPFPSYIRPVPISPEAWPQLEDPANAVPFVSDFGARRKPPVRETPSKFMNFRVLSSDRLCVDMEFNAFRRQAPKFVQTHRFERDLNGDWLFMGLGDQGCPRGSSAPGPS